NRLGGGGWGGGLDDRNDRRAAASRARCRPDRGQASSRAYRLAIGAWTATWRPRPGARPNRSRLPRQARVRGPLSGPWPSFQKARRIEELKLGPRLAEDCQRDELATRQTDYVPTPRVAASSPKPATTGHRPGQR